MIRAIRTRLSWQSFGALILLFTLNAVALGLLLDAISRQENAANYAQRAEQAVSASARLERVVVDMESGVRGYLLTGTNRFLEPYRKALVLYPTASGALIQTATTARTQRMATDIQTHIDSYVNSYLRPLVALGPEISGARTERRRDGRGPAPGRLPAAHVPDIRRKRAAPRRPEPSRCLVKRHERTDDHDRGARRESPSSAC